MFYFDFLARKLMPRNVGCPRTSIPVFAINGGGVAYASLPPYQLPKAQAFCLLLRVSIKFKYDQ